MNLYGLTKGLYRKRDRVQTFGQALNFYAWKFMIGCLTNRKAAVQKQVKRI